MLTDPKSVSFGTSLVSLFHGEYRIEYFILAKKSISHWGPPSCFKLVQITRLPRCMKSKL